MKILDGGDVEAGKREPATIPGQLQDTAVVEVLILWDVPVCLCIGEGLAHLVRPKNIGKDDPASFPASVVAVDAQQR